MLGNINGLTVLDLFAGSGALGFEALSRGAAEAHLVDSRTAAIRAINKNITKLKFENVEVSRRDYLFFLKDAAKKGILYDLIFIDPPYKMHRVIKRELSKWLPCILAPGGRIIIESSSREGESMQMELLVEKVYGDTKVNIYTIPAVKNPEQ